MTMPQNLSDIVAASEGSATSDGRSTTLQIEVGRPFKEPEDQEFPWYCTLRVDLGGHVLYEGSVAGTDSLEAMTNAIVVIASEVSRLRNEYEVSFHGQDAFAPEAFLGFSRK